MPITPNKPCRACKQILVKEEAYCPACMTKAQTREKAISQRYDTRRGTTAERGYDAAWNRARTERKESALWLCECDRCLAMGRTKVIAPSDPVHHIKPVETHPQLRLVQSNLRSMTRFCHEVEEGRARDREFEEWSEGEGRRNHYSLNVLDRGGSLFQAGPKWSMGSVNHGRP